MKTLFVYAQGKREEGMRDFTEILAHFYEDVLRTNEAENQIRKESNFRRFAALVKDYIETDPKKQSRIDNFER